LMNRVNVVIHCESVRNASLWYVEVSYRQQAVQYQARRDHSPGSS
jgi:hypothetical protein